MKLRIFLFFISLILALSACSLHETYPELPQVSFKQIMLKDTTDALNNKKLLQLTFRLIDGNGDMGLKKSDTISPFVDEYHYNCYVTMFEYINGQPVEVQLAAPFNYRIPYIEPQGQNKLLKADILLDLDFTKYDGEYLYDSVMFEFFVYDRSLNQSNIAVTPVVKLDTVGYFPEIVLPE